MPDFVDLDEGVPLFDGFDRVACDQYRNEGNSGFWSTWVGLALPGHRNGREER